MLLQYNYYWGEQNDYTNNISVILNAAEEGERNSSKAFLTIIAYQNKSLQYDGIFIIPSHTFKWVAHGSSSINWGSMAEVTWNFNSENQTRYRCTAPVLPPARRHDDDDEEKLLLPSGEYRPPGNCLNGPWVGDTLVSIPCKWYKHVVFGDNECCGLSKTPRLVPRIQNSHVRLFFTYVGERVSTNFTCKIN